MDSKLATNVDEYEQAWKFSLSNNYYLGTEGLILQYGEYEIGPYVVGLPRLTIGYDQLQKILKPEYLDQKQTERTGCFRSQELIKWWACLCSTPILILMLPILILIGSIWPNKQNVLG